MTQRKPGVENKQKPSPKKPRATPARRVRGSSTGRPVMALFDLAGRRWLLRIVWELRAAPLKFRELQEACGQLSPTLVNRRLAELRAALLVEHGEEGYALTELGRELLLVSAPLYAFADRWAKAVSAHR